MAKNNIKSKSGFTIIEVVLVLAIAGLIFLMVFVALPGLQRSRRDTQRREDMGRFMAQLTQYSSNNRGNIVTGTGNSAPTSDDWKTKFVDAYLRNDGDAFDDPSAGAYTIDYKGPVGSQIASPTAYGVIQIYQPATCNDSGTPIAADGARRIAAYIKLETGGYYCINN